MKHFPVCFLLLMFLLTACEPLSESDLLPEPDENISGEESPGENSSYENSSENSSSQVVSEDVPAEINSSESTSSRMLAEVPAPLRPGEKEKPPIYMEENRKPEFIDYFTKNCSPEHYAKIETSYYEMVSIFYTNLEEVKRFWIPTREIRPVLK